jgi:hypothetical protein
VNGLVQFCAATDSVSHAYGMNLINLIDCDSNHSGLIDIKRHVKRMHNTRETARRCVSIIIRDVPRARYNIVDKWNNIIFNLDLFLKIQNKLYFEINL